MFNQRYAVHIILHLESDPFPMLQVTRIINFSENVIAFAPLGIPIYTSYPGGHGRDQSQAIIRKLISKLCGHELAMQWRLLYSHMRRSGEPFGREACNNYYIFYSKTCAMKHYK